MEVYYVFLNVLRFTLLAINLTGNTLVTLTINKTKSLQGPTTYFLSQLAISDLSFGCVIVLTHGLSNLYGDNKSSVKPQSSSLSLANYGIMQFFYRAFVSSWILVAIAIERYLAVVKPFYHRVNITEKKLRKFVIMLWIFPLFLITPGSLMTLLWPSSYQDFPRQANSSSNFTALRLNSTYSIDSTSVLIQFGYELFLVFLCSALPAFFMGYFYGRIIYSVWFKPVSQQGTNTAILKARRKMTKLLLTVTIVFYLCWLPLFAITSNRISEKVKKAFVLFPLLSTAINPVLYGLRSKPFRQGVKSMFACCCRKKRACVEESNQGTNGNRPTNETKNL